MDFDVATALWIALIVILTMAIARTTAGYLASRDNPSAQVIGRALGAIVA